MVTSLRKHVRMRRRRCLARLACTGAIFSLAAACGDTAAATGGNRTSEVARRVALSDMTPSQRYRGFPGGLYPDGNTPPSQHDSAGRARGRSVVPLDVDGRPGPGGKVVLLSIGMSNTTQEFCSQSSDAPCDPWTFAGRAAADPAVNHGTLVIVNGARGGQEANTW